MGKEKGNFNLSGILNFPKKTKSTNSGSCVSATREDTQLVSNHNQDHLRYQDDDQESHYTFYDYSKRFLTILNYLFCILGIICAWGAIDTIIKIISKENIYVSLACYSFILIVSLIIIMLYIKLIDKDYKPYDFF
ncbi:conserved Plasmodium protein, unknown function [Plasmodium vinckei brucechwatti]|uniref:Uncharacterized protein n=1 Tax=Plasmodium vinckei brucechwatti TaxID=119398 RepID=A0A6V7T438_PLAVN|nr:conserved Plasmodium protein, unknown function [Plasmodium vinckei brucechwatti]